eukprot:6188721-Pleurochrysis_carterae.AAC.1
MDYFKNSTEVAKFFYCTGNTICMCMSLEIAMATTAITMLGPGLALRGPDGDFREESSQSKKVASHVASITHYMLPDSSTCAPAA